MLFFPELRQFTSKVDFDFILVMIGEYNDLKRKEKVVPIETSQDFAINNGFFLLEMNFARRSNLDLINKILE